VKPGQLCHELNPKIIQPSNFHTILVFFIFPFLNYYSKRKVLEGKKLLVEHPNEKL
jgi:hypothetical protein